MTAPYDDAPVIAIDGPSGTGKGTVARWLKTWLGWHLLDSGALYRILALVAQSRHIALEDAPNLVLAAAELDMDFRDNGDAARVIVAGEDVSDAIRSEECGAAASRVAALPAVRQALLERQRELRRAPGLVADGRDMGTVVFPSAVLKIFLTASPEERARRRHKQLKEKGMSVSLARLFEDIQARDERDEQRSVSPLRPASDAIILDTTGCDIGAVEEQVQRLVFDRGLARSTV